MPHLFYTLQEKHIIEWLRIYGLSVVASIIALIRTDNVLIKEVHSCPVNEPTSLSTAKT